MVSTSSRSALRCERMALASAAKSSRRSWRVVRLLKYLRDQKNNYTAKSTVLTTLVGATIRPSDEGTEADSTVADTLVTVLSRMDDYLQRNPNVPKIRNPVLPTENFNRHWGQAKYANFRTRVNSHAQTAKRAKAEASNEATVKSWKRLFGESFGKSSTGGSDGGSVGKSPSTPRSKAASYAAPATGIPVVRRPKEARRMG